MFLLKKALRIWSQGKDVFTQYISAMSDSCIRRLEYKIDDELELIHKCENGLKSKPVFVKFHDVGTLQNMLIYVLEEIRSRNMVRLEKIRACLVKVNAIVESGIEKRDLPFLDGIELEIMLNDASKYADECKWDIRNVTRREFKEDDIMFENAKKRNVNVIIQGAVGEYSPEQVAEDWEVVKGAESKFSPHAQHSEELVEKLRDCMLSEE